MDLRTNKEHRRDQLNKNVFVKFLLFHLKCMSNLPEFHIQHIIKLSSYILHTDVL